MDIIVLVKQVPDISRIPEEAWDREKGTLKRAVLDAVFNPLDLQALTFALAMRARRGTGRVICLTMGPGQARTMLEDAMARGADEAILLSDIKFAGADTPATAFALAQAVRRIAREDLKGGSYLIVSGMQSVDGDTAQVPPQVAEELGIEHIAYAQSFDLTAQEELLVTRIGARGLETVMPLQYPVLITVTNCMPAANRSFQQARTAPGRVRVWDAKAVDAAPEKVGLKGSRTWVSRIFSSATERAKPCTFSANMDELLDAVERDYRQGPASQSAQKAGYDLAGKTPTYRGEVWVYAEAHDGVLTNVTLELVAKARELAAPLGEKVGVVLPGEQVAALAPELMAAGADKVYVAEHALLKDFLPFPYKKTVAALIREYKPQIILVGATPLGRELAPRIAYEVGAGLTADCTSLEIGDQALGKDLFVAGLKQSRPALGGNIMATIMTKDSPFQMATVRPGVFTRLPVDAARKGETIVVSPPLSSLDIRSKITGREPAVHQVHLEHADIIVSGGRGIGSRGGIQTHLKPLAEALACWLKAPADIAGTRMAVEDGFVGHDRQVGQTGQTVAPKLYIAVGISGAVQHVAGMQTSGVIVAINRDPGARIFRYADYGIVGGFEDALPELIAAIQRRCA